MNHIAQLSVALTLLRSVQQSTSQKRRTSARHLQVPHHLQPLARSITILSPREISAHPSRSIPAGSPKRRPQLLICATTRI